MPNVVEMNRRMSSHLARVSGKEMQREADRIDAAYFAGRVSSFTRGEMKSSSAIRLAYIANGR